MFGHDEKLKKTFFPYSFYKTNTLNYIGNIPDKNYFDYNKMSKLEKENFNLYYEEELKKNVPYDIKKR